MHKSTSPSRALAMAAAAMSATAPTKAGALPELACKAWPKALLSAPAGAADYAAARAGVPLVFPTRGYVST